MIISSYIFILRISSDAGLFFPEIMVMLFLFFNVQWKGKPQEAIGKKQFLVDFNRQKMN